MKSQPVMRDVAGATPNRPIPNGESDASTRQRVLASILEHGPSTAAELSTRLGVTSAGIRRHLDVLLSHGQVEAREQRIYGARGRGRPAKDFVLTDVGRAGFYTAYDDMAIAAVQYLADAVGPEAVTSFAQSRLAAVEARYATYVDHAAPTTTPAQALAAALTDDGYVASTLPSAAGEQLCQHHCPVAHVAEKFPQLCEVETEAFSRLLGVHVQRLATIAHGDGVCTTHIPRASGASHVPRASGPTHVPRASGTTHIPRASSAIQDPKTNTQSSNTEETSPI